VSPACILAVRMNADALMVAVLISAGPLAGTLPLWLSLVGAMR
jgi:hypothetical protein